MTHGEARHEGRDGQTAGHHDEGGEVYKARGEVKAQKRTAPRDPRQGTEDSDLSLKLIPPFAVQPPDQQPQIRLSRPWGKRGKVSINEVADGLERIATLAAEESQDAIMLRWDLFHLTVDAVHRLNWLAKQKPEIWRDLARDFPEWPVLMSEHPQHWQRAEAIIKQLEVAAKVRPRHTRGARWSKQDLFIEVAFQLVVYVQTASSRANPPSGIYSTENWCGWRKDSARLLFRDTSTAADWWGIAKQAFLEAYPDPVKQFPELARLAKRQLNADTRQTPGRIKHRILDILESRVCTIIGRGHLTKTAPAK